MQNCKEEILFIGVFISNVSWLLYHSVNWDKQSVSFRIHD